jgi:hypothetical protein
LKDKRLAEWALRLNMKYGKMRGNKREVTIGTAHTDTVNSLNETINQSINQSMYVAGKVGSESGYRSVRKKARPREYDYRMSPPPDTVEKPSSRRCEWPKNENERMQRESKVYSSRKERQGNEKKPVRHGYGSNESGTRYRYGNSIATSNIPACRSD